MAMEGLLAHSNPQHQDSQAGLFTRSVAPPEASHIYSDSSLSSKAASIALSSQGSAGAGGSRVNKKRSRASNKTPIAVLSADSSNFRAMVQQLTGIPSIQSYPHSGIPLLKPQPSRHPYTGTSNLPTLDTSACFLGPKYMKEGLSFGQKTHQLSSNSAAPFSGVDHTRVQGRNVENNMLQSHLPRVNNEQANAISYSLSSSSPSLRSVWNSADNLKASGNLSSVYEGEQISVRQVDSLPMEEHLASKSSFNAVDSWLSYDGALVNHAPSMELARMA